MSSLKRCTYCYYVLATTETGFCLPEHEAMWSNLLTLTHLPDKIKDRMREEIWQKAMSAQSTQHRPHHS